MMNLLGYIHRVDIYKRHISKKKKKVYQVVPTHCPKCQSLQFALYTVLDSLITFSERFARVN